MSEKLIKVYQVILQTLLCVILSLAAFNARSICKEQADIKQQLLILKLNQVKILTLLNAEPVALGEGHFEWSDCIGEIHINQ